MLNTTEALDRDILGRDTHLHEFCLDSLSTADRQLVVDLLSTGSTVGITSDEDLAVVLLSILSQSADVDKVLLRCNVGLVKLEEYRYRVEISSLIDFVTVSVLGCVLSWLRRLEFSFSASRSLALRASIAA